MSMYVAADQKNWDDALSMAVYVHNTSKHSRTLQSPYKMVFRVETPDFMPETYEFESAYTNRTKENTLSPFQFALAEANRCARKYMKKSQAQYKKNYDKDVQVLQLTKGDLVGASRNSYSDNLPLL